MWPSLDCTNATFLPVAAIQFTILYLCLTQKKCWLLDNNVCDGICNSTKIDILSYFETWLLPKRSMKVVCWLTHASDVNTVVSCVGLNITATKDYVFFEIIIYLIVFVGVKSLTVMCFFVWLIDDNEEIQCFLYLSHSIICAFG